MTDRMKPGDTPVAIAEAIVELIVARGNSSAVLDGLHVTLSRGKDGMLVVEIDTAELEDRDTHPEGNVPKLRVWVNDEKSVINADGQWEVGGTAVGPTPGQIATDDVDLTLSNDARLSGECMRAALKRIGEAEAGKCDRDQGVFRLSRDLRTQGNLAPRGLLAQRSVMRTDWIQLAEEWWARAEERIAYRRIEFGFEDVEEDEAEAKAEAELLSKRVAYEVALAFANADEEAGQRYDTGPRQPAEIRAKQLIERGYVQGGDPHGWDTSNGDGEPPIASIYAEPKGCAGDCVPPASYYTRWPELAGDIWWEWVNAAVGHVYRGRDDLNLVTGDK